MFINYKKTSQPDPFIYTQRNLVRSKRKSLKKKQEMRTNSAWLYKSDSFSRQQFLQERRKKC